MKRLCPSIHLRHRWTTIDSERVCMWCGYAKDDDGRDAGRPKDSGSGDTSKPKPDNSRKRRKERKRKCDKKRKLKKGLKREYKRVRSNSKKVRGRR